MIAAFTFLFIVVLSGFAPVFHSPSVDDAIFQRRPSLEGRWNLIPVLPSDTASGKLPFLIFDTRTKRVIGNTGCNNFSGSFFVLNDKLSFAKNISSTKMICQGYNEQAFAANLMRIDAYEITGDTLELDFGRTPISYWLKQKQ